MHPYLQAAAQCYAKAGVYLRSEVLNAVTDPQTRQGIQFLIEHAEREAQNVIEAGRCIAEAQKDESR